MMIFHGRRRDLEVLDKQLERVRKGKASSRGLSVIMMGRRRVGKSRLAQEFCVRSGLPFFVFQATQGNPADRERAQFMAGLASLPRGDHLEGMQASDWNYALRSLAEALPDDVPSIVVIDEVPWLVEQDAVFEGALQNVWDLHLSHKPVLLILVGSDLSVMKALQDYSRPFFGRAAPWTVQPLDLADVQKMTELDAADSIDAHLITGGFPEIVQSWEPGTSPREFIRESLQNPLSPLVASGELSILGEFPGASHARRVLRTIGSGERAYNAIASRAGSGSQQLSAGTFAPVMENLLKKGIITWDAPLSCKVDAKNKRYRIADAYLRFWLTFIESSIPLIERGETERATELVEQSWFKWRGRAVEPLIRESLRLLTFREWSDVRAVGGWWNRQHNPEIDLVGADNQPVADSIHFAGSIKWRDDQPFGRRDYDELARGVTSIPGAGPDTPLVAVSRNGVEPNLPLAAHWGPEELVQAWHPA